MLPEPHTNVGGSKHQRDQQIDPPRTPKPARGWPPTGCMHFITPDRTSPYFPELSALLLKVLGPRQVLTEALVTIGGIQAAYIFGSWARRYQGEPCAPPGDIDVVIIGEPDVDKVYEATHRASSELGQEVNAVFLTPAEWRARRTGFVRQIRSGPLVEVTVS